MKKSTKETVLITGASSGIGYEMAKIFAKNGYDLVLVARRIEPMQALAKMFPEQKIQVISKDLTQIDQCKQLVEEIKDTTVNILVNNAGFGDHGEFQTCDLDKQMQMIHLNISALTYFTHIFGCKMVAAKSGRILNVASIVAFMPGPTMSTYFASKAFVLSFSQALSKEWGKYGVQVLTLCPGVTASGFQESSNLLKTNVGQNKNLPTAAQVAQYGFESLMKGKTLAIHGFMNKVITFLPRILPRSMYLNIIERTIK